MVIQEKIADLRREISNLANIVEDMIQKASRAIFQSDHLLAHTIVTDLEQLVDRKETENETLCIEFLALYQPEAGDLRAIVSLLKINNSLERIADHVVNIVQRLDAFTSIKAYREVKMMFDITQLMLRASLDTLVSGDMAKVKSICADDEVVDRILRELTNKVLSMMEHDSLTARNGLAALLIGRDLERIADLSTNIGEDTIYMWQGDTIKHQFCNPKDRASSAKDIET